MHPRLIGRGRWTGHRIPPIVKGTVIRVDVEHLPKPTARAKKTLWLWWSGEGEPDLDRCWHAYLRRFDIEHTFRFANPAAARSWPRPRPPASLGATERPWRADPSASAAGVSTTSCNDRLAGQPAETFKSRSRATQGHPTTSTNALSTDQEGGLTCRRGFNCKLKAPGTLSEDITMVEGD
jgi:hypothetical protein